MKILGVDPGFHFSGYAVADLQGHSVSLIDYGYLKMQPTKSLIERTGKFYDFFAEKIIKHAVTNIALETPFLGKNAQNFLKLGYLRGLLYLLADKNKLMVHEFAPREVKLALTGYGNASKDQVARVVTRLFSHMISADKYDVTDALAVTLCGVWFGRTQKSHMNNLKSH